jgi:iron complex transport system ATP-binding protein
MTAAALDPHAPGTLSVHDLSARLGSTHVLDGINLQVGAGQWLALVGPNGSGKTTLLRVLSGLLPPASGQVLLGGAVLHGLRPRARARVAGYLPQSPEMPGGLTVTEYALLGRTPYHSLLSAPRRADEAVVTEVLERLDLAPLAERRLETLSGGERQRAALARVLAQRPSVLLLDEPTAALDLGHAQQVLELIDRVRREDGTTVITTLHDLVLAGLYADSVGLLSRGRLAASGDPSAVLTAGALAEHYDALAEVTPGPAGVRIHPLRIDPLQIERLQVRSLRELR